MTNYPPLLLKYLKIFQDDPKSRIFAPLAECYRKIGEVDEAIEICKEGLEYHPDFAGGKVALARAYFDKMQFAQVRDILKSVINDAPDNLLAQKLFADSSLQQGYVNEALNAYKLILYFNPSDEEVAGLINEIETQSVEEGGLVKGKLNLGHRPEKIRKLIKLQNLLNKIQRAYA